MGDSAGRTAVEKAERTEGYVSCNGQNVRIEMGMLIEAACGKMDIEAARQLCRTLSEAMQREIVVSRTVECLSLFTGVPAKRNLLKGFSLGVARVANSQETANLIIFMTLLAHIINNDTDLQFKEKIGQMCIPESFTACFGMTRAEIIAFFEPRIWSGYSSAHENVTKQVKSIMREAIYQGVAAKVAALLQEDSRLVESIKMCRLDSRLPGLLNDVFDRAMVGSWELRALNNCLMNMGNISSQLKKMVTGSCPRPIEAEPSSKSPQPRQASY